MKIFIFYFICLFSDPRIAFELALSTMRQVEKVLVPRSQCDVCHGTGKVTAGDTVTVVERDCDNCFDDTPKEEALPVKEKYWQIHTIKGCVPCLTLKSYVEQLKKVGWKDSQFKFVEGGAKTYPTSHLVYDGKILETWTGPGNPTFWANRYTFWRTPTEWRSACKEYKGQMWEVTGSDVKSHLLEDHGQQSWQIQGLTEHELKQIHSMLHETQP